MTTELFLSPGASGKTQFVLRRARDAAKRLAASSRVIVPTSLQSQAFRRRLAEAGGAIGVRVLTFDQLYADCLSAAREAYTELTEPVQYRLLRAIVGELPLRHFASLIDRPGFIQALQDLASELKAARIFPDDFTRAIAGMGNESRLRELADIYTAYQTQLQAQGWADRAGLGWLAVEALEQRAPHVARAWPLLLVDGFDNFTAVQIALLKVLAGRVGELVITLTGTLDGVGRAQVHRRFNTTRDRLETTLQVKGEPLPQFAVQESGPLRHLEVNLFVGSAGQLDAGNTVELIEATDRTAEARAALRWIKQRIVIDQLRPRDIALLMRSTAAYRSSIVQVAAEFGIPIRLIDGLPLGSNPAIAATLDLLRSILPDTTGAQPGLPLRSVIEAWRSPYFDWSALPAEDVRDPIGILPGDAEALDTAARWGRVSGGLNQWVDTLTLLAERGPDASDEDERSVPAIVPSGEPARQLLDKFQRYVQRLTPPIGPQPYRDFVGWLEALIGPDPDSPTNIAEPTSLRIVERARLAAADLADLDIAALQSLKDVLRGLVWAEEAVAGVPIDFARFVADLSGVIEATVYSPPPQPDSDQVVVTDVVQARGARFQAVAVLGLAEGEFPATLREDPFLRDADRARLRADFGFEIDLSTASAEIEFFYETITRPRERLLLTRPRLADNGAEWQASPFWEEVRRLLNVPLSSLTSEFVPAADQAASWPELLESLSTHRQTTVERWVQQIARDRWTALETATQVLNWRTHGPNVNLFDGDLTARSAEFTQRYGDEYVWSASRLEVYRACPYRFFVGTVLHLEPRGEPIEGLDVRQLGNIYHRLFKAVYTDSSLTDRTQIDQLSAALERVAPQILAEAPQHEGFRATAWWAQTQLAIVANVRSSLEAIQEQTTGFVPAYFEISFDDSNALVVQVGDDQFRLRGSIDRIDRAPDGRLLIIDYKTGGASAYTDRAVSEGKKLQLPLYALAARDALKLGEPSDGYYWHIQQGEASRFTLSGFDGGPENAMNITSQKAWEAARGARRGHFVPQPPDEGCPPYCPAASFCWHYRPGFGG